MARTRHFPQRGILNVNVKMFILLRVKSENKARGFVVIGKNVHFQNNRVDKIPDIFRYFKNV